MEHVPRESSTYLLCVNIKKSKKEGRKGRRKNRRGNRWMETGRDGGKKRKTN